jgi:hypothetical protein
MDYFMIPFGGGYILRSKPRRLRPSSFFIAVALENKFSTLHQRKMPHKGAFDFLAERWIIS